MHKFVNQPDNVKRFIIGRQFFTVLTNFLLAQVWSTLCVSVFDEETAHSRCLIIPSIAFLSLSHRFLIAFLSLSYRFPSLSYRFSIAFQSLFNRFPIAFHRFLIAFLSLSYRFPSLSIAFLSLSNRFPSVFNRFPSLSYHFLVAF
jgi:hypothetical protein